MHPVNTSIPNASVTLDSALQGIASPFRGRLLKSYGSLKSAYSDGSFDACGLRAGRFCEIVLRLLQQEFTGTHVPFGTKIENFRNECTKLENAPASAGHESLRVLIPRALNFLYTLRNKRGIGHEGGDVDANEIDAATAVRLADWCVCELVRLKYTVSLEEAQAICDAIAERQIPLIWEIFGKRRVLDPALSFTDQTLLLLYKNAERAVPVEDLISWTEYSNPRMYRRDVLRRLHKARLIEFEEETQMVAISPLGIARIESNSKGRAAA